MFCPKCATQNLEGASFCRVCGANISLVPQALAGQPIKSDAAESACEPVLVGRRGRERELTLDHSFKNIFMGIAFLIIAIALARSIGSGWWFWMLIPAFSLMGTGVAQYLRLKDREKRTSFGERPSAPAFTDRGAPPPARGLPQRNTGELVPPPPSVTEGTTRHLGVEAATRHFDVPTDQK
jgi:zinc-ribbon domain